MIVFLLVFYIGGMIVCFFLCDSMFIVDLSISALVGYPIGWKGCFETLSGEVEEIVILWKFHAEGLDGILFDLSIGGLVVLVELFDHGLGLLLLVLVLVELV